jgi:hypothetical protein
VLVDSSLTSGGGDGNDSSNGSSSSSAGLGNLFKGGLFKGAATVSMSSTDDDRVAADESAGQVLMPKHWEEQIRTAPLGRRRVMRRCVWHGGDGREVQVSACWQQQGARWQRALRRSVRDARGCTACVTSSSSSCWSAAVTASSKAYASARLFTVSSFVPPCCRAVGAAVPAYARCSPCPSACPAHTHPPLRYVAQVAQINALEPSLRSLTDSELAEQTLRFKAALERNRHRWGARLWTAGAVGQVQVDSCACTAAAGATLAAHGYGQGCLLESAAAPEAAVAAQR